MRISVVSVPDTIGRAVFGGTSRHRMFKLRTRFRCRRLPDDSLELLLREKTRVPQIVIIEFSRNFGHHYAAHAGLQYARGEYVFLIDCDLEVSPTVLADFYTRAVKEECDAVYGYQVERKGAWLERWSGKIFWRLFNMLSETKVPANIVTERLLSRKYVDNLLRLGDRI